MDNLLITLEYPVDNYGTFIHGQIRQKGGAGKNGSSNLGQ